MTEKSAKSGVIQKSSKNRVIYSNLFMPKMEGKKSNPGYLLSPVMKTITSVNWAYQHKCF